MEEKLSTDTAFAAPSLTIKKKHPPGLAVLFLTEMWERFSFYCMLSILSLYMNEQLAGGGLGFSFDKTSDVYGWYISIVYFTPFIGGIIADRIWGIRKTIIVGGVFMMLGHFLLAFRPLPFFYSALLCLIIGNGCFKPNISVMLGNLYRDMPEKKDDAYNIFYMGINLGAFFSPLVAFSLRSLHPIHGWHYAFAAAGVGMIISMITFLVFQKHVKAGENILSNSVDDQKREIEISPEISRKRVTALLIIFAVVIFFWMAFHQNGLTMTFWARDATKSDIGSSLFDAGNIAAPAAIAEKLSFGDNPTYSYFDDKLSPQTQKSISEYINSLSPQDDLKHSLSNEIERVIETEYLYDESAFAGIEFSDDIRALIDSRPQGERLTQLNRSLLITVFPNEVMIGLPISDLPQDSINIDSDGLIRVSINVVYPISFLSILEDENNLLGEHIRNMLTDSAKALYRDYLVSLPPADSLKTLIADDFNRIIKGENIYNELAFNTIELSQTSMNLVEYNMAGNNLIRLNRMLIEETFPHELRRRPQISPEIFQSVNPFFILIFTPLIVGFWNILRKKSMEPSTAAKLGIGMLLTAGCYSIMALAGFIGGNYIQVNVSWLISAYAVITLGELCLSPMGLSLVSKLAPWKIRSMMMGGWFAATAIGNKLSGLLGRYWDDMLHSSFFILLVVTSLFAALLLFLFLKFLNPVIREAEEEAKTAAN